MNTPIRDEQFYGPDEQSPDHSKYAPKRPRAQQQSPRGDRPYVDVTMAPNGLRPRRMAAEFASRCLSPFRSHHHYQWRTARWD